MASERMLTVPIEQPLALVVPSKQTKRTTGCGAIGKLAVALVVLSAFVALLACSAKPPHHSHMSERSETAVWRPYLWTIGSISGSAFSTEERSEKATVHSYFLLDRTGSMSGLTNAVQEGFAKYVAEQQAQPGAMFLTVAQFDSQDPFEVLVEKEDIHATARRLEKYQPRGTTPLYDAIERMIAHAELTSHGSDEVIIVIFTDGAENASRQATRQSVFDKIEEKKKRGWSFVFLGANMDSFQAGSQINVAKGSTMNYAATPQGLDYGWGTVSSAMRKQRTFRARSDYNSAERVAAASSFFSGVDK